MENGGFRLPTSRALSRTNSKMDGAPGAWIATGAFLLAALWVVWPAPLHATWAMPSGDSPVGTVPMLNAWIQWWNADRVLHFWSGYWHAPIFYPARYAFGLSEPQPLTALVAPIIWTSGPVPAYNVYLVAMLTLNGVFTRRLMKDLGVGPGCAAAAGLAMVLHPLAVHNLEAVQLAVLWPVVWLLHRLILFGRVPTWRSGLIVGIAGGLVGYACLHHTLIAALPLAASLGVLVVGKRWSAWLPPLLASGGLALLFTGPLAYGVGAAAAEHGVSRHLQTVQALSAQAADWLTLPATAWEPTGTSRTAQFPLSPGWLRVILACAAVAGFASARRRELLFLFVTALIALFLSFGANLPGGLWTVATHWLPPLQWARSPYRFAYLFQTCIILLAFCALDQLRLKISIMTRAAPLWRRAAGWSPIILGIVLTLEIPPPRTALCFPPASSMPAPWVQHLMQVSHPDDVMVCLPVAPDSSEAGMETETRWMMYQTQHRLRLLNGYSGFIPRHWAELRTMLRKAPLNDETIDALEGCSVRWIIVRRSPSVDAWSASTHIRWVYEDAQFRLGELVSTRQ
ncbi:MAG: hypothetical protein D6753_16975 [Planctomycetota bacterium]|nr:MAG: hypothetical protein D6753_16975 [Planctomycetota bacterium]